MDKIFIKVLFVLACCFFTVFNFGCKEEECNHNIIEATCERVSYCDKCGKEFGDVANHNIIEATCERASYCEKCNKEFGDVGYHNIVDGYCTVCGQFEPIVYELSYDKTSYSVCGVVGKQNNVVIPSQYHNLPVISIRPYAFYQNSYIQNVVIPEEIKNIGYGAFYNCKALTSVTILGKDVSIGNYAFSSCYGLTSITIPEGVTSIGEGAFYGCTSLTSIIISESVTSIGEGAFESCTSLESITIPFVGAKADGSEKTHFGYIFGAPGSNYTGYVPTSLKEVIITGGTSISSYAFLDCTSLTSITIPESVTSIGNNAFSNCTSLTSITIPESVTSIGNNAFSNCTSLTYNIYDNAKYLGNKNNPYYILIEACNTNIRFCDINNQTKIIYDSAFLDCTSLSSITIPESVTSIGMYAFENCASLESITIPESVTSIGEHAFDGCTSLAYNVYDNAKYLGNKNNPYYILIEACNTNIRFCDINNQTKIIYDSAFRKCTSLESITIPESVTSIGSYAFYYCTSLTSITIPESVTSIGNYAFNNCTSLESITIPESVTSIGYRAFYECTSLTSITIPEGVTSIGMYAFENCTSLTSITIPESVTSIGEHAFDGCTSLESITIPFVGEKADGSGKTHFGYIFGASYYSYNSIYVPTSLIEVIITDGTSIGSYAFSGCTSLESITIPESVTSIGEHAFDGCRSLAYNVYDNAKYLGNKNNPYYILIEACNTNIRFCDINNQTKIIYDSAFLDCTSLTSITIPESVTSIGNNAFSNCTSLTYNIYDNAKYLGNDENPYLILMETVDDNIAECIIYNKTKFIYSGAFSGCRSLTSITIPESVTSIGNFAFYGCTSLIIYCELDEFPKSWNKEWNKTLDYTDLDGNMKGKYIPVVWGFKGD